MEASSELFTYESQLEARLEAVRKHNYTFMQNYKEAMSSWRKIHGAKKNPPVYKDKSGRYYWANRKQRRKLKKA